MGRTWQHFNVDVAGSVASITLDRPDRLNALTFDVYADLRDLFAELPHRDDVAVVTLSPAAVAASAPAVTSTRSSGLCSRRMRPGGWSSPA